MPIYEFYSPDTHRIYSFFARSLAYAGQTPRCPDGEQYRMVKQISGFAVTGLTRKGREEGGDGEDLDDPRMAGMMAEMEREMASMDEENPDPRAMGRMMRRMAEMSGERLPPAMEEMLGRMEKGEDPDRLEEEYGDLLDAENGEMGGEDAGEGDSGSGGLGAYLRKKARQPRRDPELYDMADYVGQK